MPRTIDKLVDTFHLLCQQGVYYEQELFTKFQDMFLVKGINGVTIIHSHRSMVKFRNGTSFEKSELGDVLLFFFEPNTGKVRQLFLQFKLCKTKSSATERSIPYNAINDKQLRLYSKHPKVEFAASRKASFPFHEDILKDKKYGIKKLENSGTMYVVMEDSVPYPEFYVIGPEHLDIHHTRPKKIVWKKGASIEIDSSSKYEYLVYAESLSDFLKCASEMKVGMEISETDYVKYLEKGVKGKVPIPIIAIDVKTLREE
ncbi:hypothetical protein [Lacrimispora saccharolytica]|uniref:hypothetical protein n=1 Tax=Lacrimispora saccharolytica TaxID=84030 RepID=UPI00265CD1DB|nr:hypothetical protein [Lacrimispora saccharolytica]MCF2656626.1 hypothetical protein [Lacrimispora saccharolytica]